MVRRARIRLTLLFIAMFAGVLAVFSIVFYVAFAIVLQPDFDVAPELTTTQVAEAAYGAAIARIGVSIVIADAAAVLIVGFAAWVLAKRTLEPIRDAHARQQRFVADASHETRNPLAAIKATTGAALDGARSPEDLRAALRTVDTSVDRLIRLTGDLLVLARANDPLAPTRRQPSDLSVIVAEALEVATPSESHRISTDLRTDLPVMVDPDEIERIVRNLVENALRYGIVPGDGDGDADRDATADGEASGIGGAITVRTRSSEAEVWLEIHDEGPGIAAADIDRIFDPFYRSTARGQDREGVGLGLAIARDLAQRNGARLTVSSSPGAGATFRLALPRLR